MSSNIVQRRSYNFAVVVKFLGSIACFKLPWQIAVKWNFMELPCMKATVMEMVIYEVAGRNLALAKIQQILEKLKVTWKYSLHINVFTYLIVISN